MTTISAFTRQLLPALLSVLVFTVVCGLAYPIGIWLVSRLDADSADGAPLADSSGCIVGSALIGTDVPHVTGQPDPYLHGRVRGDSDQSDPVAAAMAPGDPSAGAPSNLGPSNTDLAAWIDTRRQQIAKREGVDPAAVPVDAVTGSGSGLDPDISPEYAALQVPRIARATGMSESEVTSIIAAHTSGRSAGILGEPRVHVLQANLDLGRHPAHCATPGETA